MKILFSLVLVFAMGCAGAVSAQEKISRGTEVGNGIDGLILAGEHIFPEIPEIHTDAFMLREPIVVTQTKCHIRGLEGTQFTVIRPPNRRPIQYRVNPKNPRARPRTYPEFSHAMHYAVTQERAYIHCQQEVETYQKALELPERIELRASNAVRERGHLLNNGNFMLVDDTHVQLGTGVDDKEQRLERRNVSLASHRKSALQKYEALLKRWSIGNQGRSEWKIDLVNESGGAKQALIDDIQTLVSFEHTRLLFNTSRWLEFSLHLGLALNEEDALVFEPTGNLYAALYIENRIAPAAEFSMPERVEVDARTRRWLHQVAAAWTQALGFVIDEYQSRHSLARFYGAEDDIEEEFDAFFAHYFSKPDSALPADLHGFFQPYIDRLGGLTKAPKRHLNVIASYHVPSDRSKIWSMSDAAIRSIAFANRQSGQAVAFTGRQSGQLKGFQRPPSWSTDFRRLHRLRARLDNGMQLLSFVWPNNHERLAIEGCALIPGIMRALGEFKMDFVDPIIGMSMDERYAESQYVAQVLDLLGTINEYEYHLESPREFLNKTLPEWHEICRGAERLAIEKELERYL